MKDGRLTKFAQTLPVVAAAVACGAVALAEGESADASTVITAMTTGLTAAQGNIIAMVNAVVPVGVGVFAVTSAIRIGKRMFKIAGGSGN